jgi:hypothetical protein
MATAFTTFKNYDAERQVSISAAGATPPHGRCCGCHSPIAAAAACRCCRALLGCLSWSPPCPLIHCCLLTHCATPCCARCGRAVQGMMRAQMQRIMDTEGLSANVFEIVSKSLKD